jgi:hypothetical protein
MSTGERHLTEISLDPCFSDSSKKIRNAPIHMSISQTYEQRQVRIIGLSWMKTDFFANFAAELVSDRTNWYNQRWPVVGQPGAAFRARFLNQFRPKSKLG